MSFSSFSKDYTERALTSVENQFITKYLPEADGDAVRVYLYGLYLCSSARDFDAASAAKLLGIPSAKFTEYFAFWEECGLVQILSRDPLFVEYLPVNSAVGKPKPIRPEKYAAFNRELFKLLQQAGKDLKPYEQQRILEFLETNPMEHQAFLLVVEYSVRRDKELTVAHILNRAKALVRENKCTYEQVEAEYADFNAHQEELLKIFNLLGVFRKPQESDYELLAHLRQAGMEIGAVYAAAENLKKGSMKALRSETEELLAANALTEQAVRAYYENRSEETELAFKIGKKLGVKVQSARAMASEYVGKWKAMGYTEEDLLALASLGMKLSFGYPELDAHIGQLAARGITGSQAEEYCRLRERQLKLLQRIQSVCGVVKKTESALDTAERWLSMGFSEEMILEAAKRSANAAAPLPYITKLLNDWKELGVFAPSEIPERENYKTYKSETAVAADERSERERYYAARRERAERRAERALSIARKDEEFVRAETDIRKGEIETARAEVFSPEELPRLKEALEQARARRESAMLRLHLSERDFLPRYACEKCSDTGFLPDGRLCDCYQK